MTLLCAWFAALRFATQATIDDEEAARRWQEAIASIADEAACPRYGGLRLARQQGLVPIGRDPESGLWEFAHPHTGEPARRGSDGKLVLQESTGLVFVLLSGGTFSMGAQRSDANAPNHDPLARDDEGPVHDVTLGPFFLSKYEMTQGQWLRVAGSNPSRERPDAWVRGKNAAGLEGDLLHPVEQVSWNDCTSVLRRFGLALPSEAQWECAVRGGATSPWWTGTTRESLRGAGNLADDYLKAHAPERIAAFEDGLDDGNAVHARVGSFRANGLGLHDVIGNVMEWCQDGYEEGSYRRATHEPVDPIGPTTRVVRGSSYTGVAQEARSAYRWRSGPEYRVSLLGLRPAKRVQP